MIEDLQDELQRQQPERKERTPHRRGAFLLLAFFFWIIYSAVLILAFMPKMIVAFRESDIVRLISEIDERKAASETRDAKLCFVIPKSDGSTTFVTCSQKITKTGASEYHDVVEGLLEGPKSEALSTGAISYIDRGTHLIGLTVSESTVFVNLSESFTGSGSSWGPNGLETACKQITKTIQALDPGIRDVIILINGDVLSV